MQLFHWTTAYKSGHWLKQNSLWPLSMDSASHLYLKQNHKTPILMIYYRFKAVTMPHLHNNLTNQNWTMTSNVLNLKFNEIVMYRMVRVTDLYLYWVEASVKSRSQTRPCVGWLTLQNTSQTTMLQFSQTLIRFDISYAVYPKTFSHDFF